VSITLRGKDLYTVGEVARLLRKSGRMVRADLATGKLAGVKVSNTWLIPAESVAESFKNVQPRVRG